MIRDSLLGVAVTILLLSCSWTPGPIDITPSQYRVRHGDTLYSIAWRYGLETQSLAEWNRLSSPFTLTPGQRLHLNPPPGFRKSVTVTRPPGRRPVSSPGKIKPRQPAVKPATSSTISTAPYPTQTTVIWQWPTAGRIVAYFSANGAKSGIDIQGRIGQPVVAAAGGKVVYSGNGLKGYGELVIIKHSEELLSAYAYNRKRLVKEGAWVQKGQRIAELGARGKDRALLHFEIRKQGKAVNPMNYLPTAP